MASKAALPGFTKLDVLEVDGTHCSLNNRRLYCLKKAAAKTSPDMMVHVRVHRLRAPVVTKFIRAWIASRANKDVWIRGLLAPVIDNASAGFRMGNKSSINSSAKELQSFSRFLD